MLQSRRLLSLLVAVSLMLSALVPFAAASAASVSVTAGEITGSNVAFRKGASSSSGLIRRLDKGTMVEILETNVNAEWHRVRYKGTVGFVNRLYVSIDASLPAYNAQLVGTVVNCTTEVNVRSAPKSGAKLLGTAKKGEAYSVTKKNAASGWHEIRFNGTAGYISAKYLSLAPAADDAQLASLTVTGGTMSPAFAPGEYGYVVVADSDKLTVEVTANKGVRVSVDGTGKSKISFTMPKSGSRTVRITVNGKTRYSLYFVRNALIVGSWNVKRGNGSLVLQGRLIETQQPDLMGIQEVYRNIKTDPKSDTLLSLRTRDMQNMSFAQTVGYASGGQYGIGVLSRYKLSNTEIIKLTSLDKEPRVLQKTTVSVDGKKVSFYNTHFSYDSSTIRTKQFAEVLEILGKDPNPYIILVGDFNAQATEFARIKGFQVLNQPDTKFYGYDGGTIKKNVIDNIIVSKSITVLNVRMIDTDLSDHKPIFAYLRLD